MKEQEEVPVLRGGQGEYIVAIDKSLGILDNSV